MSLRNFFSSIRINYIPFFSFSLLASLMVFFAFAAVLSVKTTIIKNPAIFFTQPVEEILIVCPDPKENIDNPNYDFDCKPSNPSYRGGSAIQKAINDLKTNGVVFIKRGIYPNALFSINESVFNKNNAVSIIGEDVKTTILKSESDCSLAGCFNFVVDNKKILISGLTFDGFSSGLNVYNYKEEGEIKIIGNIIKNTHHSVLFFSFSNPLSKVEVKNNLFINNLKSKTAQFAASVFITGKGKIEIINNTFYANQGSALVISNTEDTDLSSITIKNNIFAMSSVLAGENLMGKGIELWRLTNEQLAEAKGALNFGYNLFWHNQGGCYSENEKLCMEKGNFIEDPKLDLIDFYPQFDSPVLDKGDPLVFDVDGTISDIGAYGGTEVCFLDRNFKGCRL